MQLSSLVSYIRDLFHHYGQDHVLGQKKKEQSESPKKKEKPELLRRDSLNHQRFPVPPPVSTSFSSATFSDQSRILLRPSDITVFVGPNNCGKSVALSDLER